MKSSKAASHRRLPPRAHAAARAAPRRSATSRPMPLPLTRCPLLLPPPPKLLHSSPAITHPLHGRHLSSPLQPLHTSARRHRPPVTAILPPFFTAGHPHCPQDPTAASLLHRSLFPWPEIHPTPSLTTALGCLPPSMHHRARRRSGQAAMPELLLASNRATPSSSSPLSHLQASPCIRLSPRPYIRLSPRPCIRLSPRPCIRPSPHALSAVRAIARAHNRAAGLSPWDAKARC